MSLKEEESLDLKFVIEDLSLNEVLRDVNVLQDVNREGEREDHQVHLNDEVDRAYEVHVVIHREQQVRVDDHVVRILDLNL